MPIRVVNDQKKEKIIALVKEILELEEKIQGRVLKFISISHKHLFQCS